MKTQGIKWCGEGDLNPHKLAFASTSSYSKHTVLRVYIHLERYFRSHRVLSGISVGTNTPQKFDGGRRSLSGGEA